jgi:hypothetical protein
MTVAQPPVATCIQDEEKQQFAAASLDWNLRHNQIPNMFPSLKEKAAQRANESQAGASTAAESEGDQQGTSAAATNGAPFAFQEAGCPSKSTQPEDERVHGWGRALIYVWAYVLLYR